jgi:hypothetical protein
MDQQPSTEAQQGAVPLDCKVGRQSWKTCRTHGPDKPNAWACPECLRELREENKRLRSLVCEPMRVITVEAIREVTGCPDISGNGKYLVDVLMYKVREYVTANV